MFDLAFFIESVANFISNTWNALVLPYKPIWIVLVVAILAKFYFRKSRIN